MYFEELYPKVLEDIINLGRTSAPRGLPIVEVLGYRICLTDTSRRFMRYSNRDVNPVFPIVELMWMLSGSDSPDVVCHYVSKMSEYVNPCTGVFDGAYGARWRRWGGDFDQIAALISRLKNDPASRRAVITTWNPSKDSNDLSLDIPCNIMMQFFIREGKLEMINYVRSQDAWLGMANDIIEWTILQHILAGWLGVEPGVFYDFFGSLHLYSQDVSKAKALIASNDDRLYVEGVRFSSPTLDFRSFNVTARTFYRVEKCSRLNTESFKILHVDAQSIDNTFWRNATLAVLAYNARKHGKLEMVPDIVGTMDENVDLTIVLKEWLKRRGVCFDRADGQGTSA